MFGFLKKLNTEKATKFLEDYGVVKVKEISIDQQIYNDVYSAQDKLIEEANRILATPLPYEQERYNRLEKLYYLGFRNAEEVKEFFRLKGEREEKERIQSYINKYKIEYPFNKFIDQNTVKKVCEKYKLYLTEVGSYVDEIPEKNQNEIINFKIKRKYIRFPYEVCDVYSMRIFDRHYDEEDYDENEKVEGRHLLIIAPEHKLDLKGKEKDGYKIKIKDPIVLQPVDGGYLIVSSWGLEASDEMVANQINN